jgi:hypothetical protein
VRGHTAASQVDAAPEVSGASRVEAKRPNAEERHSESVDSPNRPPAFGVGVGLCGWPRSGVLVGVAVGVGV